MADILLNGTTNPIGTHVAVRLACGVSTVEFPDQAFLDLELAEDLELKLTSWLSEASLDYVTIIDDGIPAASPTAAERADYLNLRKYSKYYLAAQMVKSMSLGFAEQITDGQNSFKRFFTDPDELIERLMGVAEEAKDEILDAHDSLPANQTILTGANPNYDPVTDESEV